MRVRLGYVAIALRLPKVTSSSNVTYTYYKSLYGEEKRLNKLKQITLSNIVDLEKILEYNIENQIHFYRITSNLIPLATHPEVIWNYREIFAPELRRIGKLIKEHEMRVDTHPDQFNVINSIQPSVVENTKRNLLFHVNLFKDLEYPFGKMVLHVGSSQGGKSDSLSRFIENFDQFPKEITSKLIMENDDKTFTALDTLMLCKQLKLPMVLDIHHHLCNNNDDNLTDYLPDIFSTWDNEVFPPKVHVSSPKDSPLDRKHADFIDGKFFIDFIETCKDLNRDIDIMIEAKMKDLALLDLVKKIKELRPDYKWIDESTFMV